MIKKYITFHWQRLVKKKSSNEWTHRNGNYKRPTKIWSAWRVKFSTNRNKRRPNIKYKNIYYKLTPIGILFPSSVKNDTKQIFVTCRELNNAKNALIDGKIVNILGIINLKKINNWEHIKGNSFRAYKRKFVKQIINIDHLSFSFKTLSLNDMLSFSVNLVDDDNKPI